MGGKKPGWLKTSLKARMTTYFLLVSTPVVVALALTSYFLAATILKQMAIARFELISDQKALEIRRFMADQSSIVGKIAGLQKLRQRVERLLALEPGSPAYQAAYLQMADSLFEATFVDYGAAAASDLTEIQMLSDIGGRVFFATNPVLEGQYRLSDRYFVQGRRELYIQPVYPDWASGAPTLTVSAPLTSLDGKPMGVLAAQIRLPVLVEIVSRRTGLGNSGESYLIDGYNRFLSADRVDDQRYPRGVHSAGIDAAIGGASAAGQYRNYAGIEVIGSYRWLPQLGLALMTEIRVAEALQPATRLGWMMLGLGLLAVMLLALGIYLITRQIARPILAVTATTHKIAAGDLDQRAPVLTADETGQLAENFNHMIDRLKATLEQLALEQGKSERLLLNILPEPIAHRLKQGEDDIADSFAEVTILFADIVNFTPMSVDLPPTELVSLLNEIFSEFDRLSEKRGLEKIKTIGDAYMVGAGLPIERDDHAEVIAEMALDMLVAIEQFNHRHHAELSIRIGINTGAVVAGVIGTKKFIYDIWGDAVNTAARMESQGIVGQIQVTEATYHYLKDGFTFVDRGLINVKGKGNMHTYILKGRKDRGGAGSPRGSDHERF